MANSKTTAELTAEYQRYLSASHVTESQHERMIELSRLLGIGVFNRQDANGGSAMAGSIENRRAISQTTGQCWPPEGTQPGSWHILQHPVSGRARFEWIKMKEGFGHCDGFAWEGWDNDLSPSYPCGWSYVGAVQDVE